MPIKVAEAKPFLDQATNGQVPRVLAVRSLLRDPNPWEDGYFDPSYHAWPKNRQSSASKVSKQHSES